MTADNLLPVPETRLADDPEVQDAVRAASGSPDRLKAVAAAYPTSSLAWAMLSDAVFDQEDALESYAYARVGYHRGLDALRKAGWRGQGPIPWSHEPNRGVLRSLYALRRAAKAIGETDEVDRLTDFLQGADPEAVDAIESASAPAAAPSKTDPTAPPTESFVIRSTN